MPVRQSAFQIAVKEVRDDVEDFILHPVDAAVLRTLDDVALGRDAGFLQRLEQQVGFARRDDGVGRAVHQKHRGARLADVVDRVRGFCSLGVRGDAAMHAPVGTMRAESSRAVNRDLFFTKKCLLCCV